MAILNYAVTLTDAYKSKYLTNVSDSDKKALIFTGDGHIITHGTDYYAVFQDLITSSAVSYTFTSGTNGSFTVTPYVGSTAGTAQTVSIGKPSTAGTADKVANSLTFGTKTYNGSAAVTLLLTDLGGFAASNVVAKANYSTASGDDKVFSVDAVKAYFQNAMTQAMVFKGTINQTSDIPTASTTKVGDTYKVGTAGTYTINSKSQVLEVGDTIICESVVTTNGTTTITWSILQSDIKQQALIVNADPSSSSNNVVIYGSGMPSTLFIPTTAGSSGQILMSGTTVSNNVTSYAAPKWVSVSPSLAYDTSNKLKVTVLGSTSSSIDIKTTYSLSAGTGISLSANFNGSANSVVSLKTATSSEIGGVQIGFTYSETLTNNTSVTSRKYPVVLSSNKAYVDVPWTWRDIQTAGDSIGNNTLNFSSGESVLAIKTESNNVTTISYDLRWYDLDAGKWES